MIIVIIMTEEEKRFYELRKKLSEDGTLDEAKRIHQKIHEDLRKGMHS